MSTIPQVDNPSFLTLAAAAKLLQFDKELADLEASDYYKEAKTATSLQHCVGTSLANERGDIEHPPPMDVWPKPCLDTRCICGHKRTWCSYYCHHSDLALETVHEWPCQDGRVCGPSKEGRGKCTIGAHCCRDGDARWLGLALTCNSCNRFAYGAEFQNKSDIDWLPLPPLWPIFFPVSEGYRVYQFYDARAEEPALNFISDPRQREATVQWRPIEAERKEDARLAALTADQQKEEEESPTQVSGGR